MTSVHPTTDAARRTETPTPKGLDAIFRPRSVAVIGASRHRGTVGGEIFHNLLAHGFEGPVYPVNPHAAVVQSVAAYGSVESIPGPVDLAVIVVPAHAAVEAVEACGRKGVLGAVVISAGFKETGPSGASRERALAETARRYGMRIVGPNCLGVLNTEPGVRLDATFASTYPPAGRVAFSSQSGALGLAILDTAKAIDLGISHFASIGNKADVSGNDLLEYWEHDSGTSVILLYLESFGNPRRFRDVARRVARTKPIIAVKSGRTSAGARAASSHTGSLAGTDRAVDALCRQSGVIRTNTIEELFDVALLLANQPVPRGNRVGIVTNAGGPAIMATDACESHGLAVSALSDATVEALRAFLPAEASVRNPVDMIASATRQSFEQAVRVVLEDPGIDAVLVIYVPPMVTTPTEVAHAIVEGASRAKATLVAQGGTAKPVLSCFMGSHGVPEGLRSLHQHHIPSYRFPEAAAIALARAVQHGRWLAEPEGNPVVFDDVDRVEIARAMASARQRATAAQPVWLRPEEVAAVLRGCRIATPTTEFAPSADLAVIAANRMGYPVALKLASDTITHKSDVGGVHLDLRSDAEVRTAFAAVRHSLQSRGLSDHMTGVTIQSMSTDGVEAIVGVTLDPTFGHLVMFGLGGMHVELLQDVEFRIAPLLDRDAADMVLGVRGAPLLAGWRGAPAADLAALQQVLLRISQLVTEHPEVAELDLNPLHVRANGLGCVAVDARISVRA